MSLADQQWCPTSVQVTALQARGLRVKGKSGTNDAYALLQVGKDKFQTSVVEKSVTPVWKEEATFDLPPLQVRGGGSELSTLQVQVLHRALVGPDKLLGQAVINLLQLSEDTTRNKTEWFRLLDKQGKPDKDRGEVLLDIQFMRNNMTASMFDLSGAGKSRSRLGKFKDKVRGKKKELDSSPGVVPALTQVMIDSEEEANGDGKEATKKDGKSKKLKVKSLFSSKSNLQKTMSQSMSVLPVKNSSLSGSQSSGLNMDPTEGKKKFKFKIHKRSGSSDSKDLSFGNQKRPSVEQSNMCINGSHVYCEEPQPRTSRAGSNFSLASSGHGSMEDVPDNSSPSLDSLRAVRQYSPWMEEEEDEERGENKQETENQQSREDVAKMEEERMRRKEEEEENILKRQEELKRIIQKKEEEKRAEEEKIREEELQRLAEEKRRLEEQEKNRLEEEKMEEERKAQEDKERQQEEERKLAEKIRIEEEIRMEELRRQKEEEERTEEMRRKEEEDMMRRQKELEEMRRAERDEVEREQEEMRRKEEEEILRRQEEERRRKLEEERQKENERKKREEEMRKKEEEDRAMKQKEEEEMRRKEEEEEILRRQEEERRRKLEEERQKENERKKREEEMRKKEEEDRAMKQKEEEEMKREQEERQRKEEEEMLRRQEELERELEKEKLRLEREAEEERLKREEEERIRVEKEIQREEEERRLKELERLRQAEEERMRKEEQEKIRIEEKRRQEDAERARRMEENERIAQLRRLEEQKKRQIEEEKLRKEEEERKLEEENLINEQRAAELISTNPFDEDFSQSPFEETANFSSEAQSHTVKEGTVKQRCESAVVLEGSHTVSSEEMDLIRIQREKRPAPQPPGSDQDGRQSRKVQDVAERRVAQINNQNPDSKVKTVISDQNKSPTDLKNTQSLTQTSEVITAKHGKRLAPSRPPPAAKDSSELKTISSAGKIPQMGATEREQVQPIHVSNPFEDELSDQEDSSVSAPVCWPPALAQTADREAASQVKLKSSKMARAPAPPAKIDASSGDNIINTGFAAPNDQQQDRTGHLHVNNGPNQDSQHISEKPPSSRRLLPVKPLNPSDQPSTSFFQEDIKSPGIGYELHAKNKVPDTVMTGPYSQLTREELISLVLKQESQLFEKQGKISELEQYIDNLMVRIIEEQPSILMSTSASLKKVA